VPEFWVVISGTSSFADRQCFDLFQEILEAGFNRFAFDGHRDWFAVQCCDGAAGDAVHTLVEADNRAIVGFGVEHQHQFVSGFETRCAFEFEVGSTEDAQAGYGFVGDVDFGQFGARASNKFFGFEGVGGPGFVGPVLNFAGGDGDVRDDLCFFDLLFKR
jgi:hypothetical protein